MTIKLGTAKNQDHQIYFETTFHKKKRKVTAAQVMLSAPNSSICIYFHSLMKVKLCPTLCDPMDCSLPDSSVHGILQTRILEWVAISSSRGCCSVYGLNLHLLRPLHWQADSLPLCRLGNIRGIGAILFALFPSSDMS